MPTQEYRKPTTEGSKKRNTVKFQGKHFKIAIINMLNDHEEVMNKYTNEN